LLAVEPVDSEQTQPLWMKLKDQESFDLIPRAFADLYSNVHTHGASQGVQQHSE